MTQEQHALAVYQKAYCARRDAQEREAAACKKAFPPGTEVAYFHGDDMRFAVVVENNEYFPRFRVKGSTGSVYWLDGTRVHCVSALPKKEESR